MIHYKIWGLLEDFNEAVIPGKGKLVGFDVKRDFFNPVDLIPFVGPLSKLYKAAKVLKHAKKIKYAVVGGVGLAADVFAVKEAVDWYNARYRAIAEEIVEESPSPSQSGNADDKISGGGGTKKKTRRSPRTAHVVRCRATKKIGKFRGQCVREKGHSGAHFYK